MTHSNPFSAATPPVQDLAFHHSAGKRSPIELVRTADLRRRDSGIYKPTRLDFHILVFVTRGRGKHWVDFHDVRLGRGDLLHIKPAQVHSFDPGSRHEALLLLFRPEAVPDSNSLDLLNVHMEGAVRPKAADFRTLLEILKHYEFQQSNRGAIDPDRLAPYCLGAVVVAIGDLLTSIETLQRRAASQAALKLVSGFEHLIQEHHASHRDLAWYVPRLNVTGRTLARACHQVRGKSPKKLIDGRIALEAKRQLILTGDSIEELAFSLGFSESTNFVKFFKRIVGETPEAFRSNRA